MNMSNCGTIWGCFRRPSNCTDPNCDMLAMWRDIGKSFFFMLSFNTKGWAAVGFSLDQIMVQFTNSERLVKLKGSKPFELDLIRYSLVTGKEFFYRNTFTSLVNE